MLKNNKFSKDTDLDRLERVLALSTNIDSSAPETDRLLTITSILSVT